MIWSIFQSGLNLFVSILFGGMAVVLCLAALMWFVRRIFDLPGRRKQKALKGEKEDLKSAPDAEPFSVTPPKIESSFGGKRIGEKHESNRG